MRAFVVAILTGLAALPGTAGGEEPLVTPDQPAYVNKLTQEQIDLVQARDPGTRVEVMAAIADQRVRELKACVESKRTEHVAPLANAYLRLVGEGIAPVVVHGEREGLDLTGSLVTAERSACKHPLVLEELSLSAPSGYDGLFQKAVEAARQHLADLRRALARARGQRGGELEQDSPDELEMGGERPPTDGGLGIDLRDLRKPSEGGGGGGSGDDRRKGRGD